MIYRVIYGPTFRDHLRGHIQYLCSKHVSQPTIDGWYNRLFDLIDSLDVWPRRFPIDEQQSAATGREIRKFNVGHYLIYYHVDDNAQVIQLVAFRHGAQTRPSDFVAGDE